MPGTIAMLRLYINVVLLSALGLLVAWAIPAFFSSLDFLRLQDWWYLEVFLGVPSLSLLLVLVNAFPLQSEAISPRQRRLRRVGLVVGFVVLGLATLWFVGDAIIHILDQYYNYS